MNKQLETAEALYAEAKNKNSFSAAQQFYDMLWVDGVMMPAAARRDVVERMYTWTKENEIAQPKLFCLASLSIGFLFFHEGNYEASINSLMEAQKFFEAQKDDDGVAICSAMIGCDYRTFGDVELAIKYLLDSFHQLSKTGNYKPFLIYDAYHLAEIYSETNQLTESLRLHEIAFKLEEEIGNKNMAARSLCGFGIIYQQQKRFGMALENFERALQISIDTNNLQLKAKVLTDLGNYYTAMEEYDNAISYHEQALAIRQEQKIPGGLVTNQIHLAELFMKQGKNDEAISILDKALLVAEEIKVKPKIFQIHLLLSDIYKLKNELTKSIFHFKAYHEIREQVMHEDAEKKIKNMQLVFEAEQTKKENVIIKAQKKEIEIKNTELQNTIDELTRARVSKKAKALTMTVAVVLMISQESFMRFFVHQYTHGNFLISLGINGVIVLLLKPIESGIEEFLLKRVK